MSATWRRGSRIHLLPSVGGGAIPGTDQLRRSAFELRLEPRAYGLAEAIPGSLAGEAGDEQPIIAIQYLAQVVANLYRGLGRGDDPAGLQCVTPVAIGLDALVERVVIPLLTEVVTNLIQ